MMAVTTMRFHQLKKSRQSHCRLLVATPVKSKVSPQMSLMTVARNFLLSDIPPLYVAGPEPIFDAVLFG